MHSILTLSNLMSFSRILLAIPFLYFLSRETETGNYIALLFALLGMLTDFLDGIIARKFNTVTTFGKYLDPVADKICVFAGAIYLSFFRGTLPVWFTLLIIAKDVLLLAGGAFLIFKRKRVIQADLSGKWTVFIVSLTFVCFILDYPQPGMLFLYASLLLILYSTAHYVIKSVPLFRKSV